MPNQRRLAHAGGAGRSCLTGSERASCIRTCNRAPRELRYLALLVIVVCAAVGHLATTPATARSAQRRPFRLVAHSEGVARRGVYQASCLRDGRSVVCGDAPALLPHHGRALPVDGGDVVRLVVGATAKRIVVTYQKVGPNGHPTAVRRERRARRRHGSRKRWQTIVPPGACRKYNQLEISVDYGSLGEVSFAINAIPSGECPANGSRVTRQLGTEGRYANGDAELRGSPARAR